FILTVAAAVAGGATSASADSFDLTSCHLSGGCGGLAQPYGTVTLTAVNADNGADGLLDDVHVSVSGPSFVFFAGGGDLQGAPAGQNVIFAFNGTGVAVGDIVNVTTTEPPPPVGATAVTGTFSVNGNPQFGNFSFGIACSCNGQSDQISALSFDVLDATIG